MSESPRARSSPATTRSIPSFTRSSPPRYVPDPAGEGAIRATITALALGLAAVPALAEPAPAAWTATDAGTLTGTDELAEAGRRFPESAAIRLRRLNLAFAGGDADSVRAALIELARMGYVFAPATLERIAAVAGAAAVAEAADLMEPHRRPITASRPLATVPTTHRLVEGLAFDPLRDRLFVSSVVDRQLLRRHEDGWTPVEGLEPGSLFGLAFDAARDRLWVASGRVDQTPNPETAFRGLIAIDAETLRVVGRVPAPEGGAPADITVAPDGTVFASDPQRGALYRLAPGTERIEALVPPGRLRSPQGIAVVEGGRRLYVADYSYGIAIVDTVTGEVTRLAGEGPMMLSGVDGLFLHDGALIAIQNGVEPRRILRIALDPTGTRAVAVEPIERGHPEWGEPTLGQIVDGGLLYVSDAQWERFGAGGALVGEAPLRPTVLRRLPLARP